MTRSVGRFLSARRAGVFRLFVLVGLCLLSASSVEATGRDAERPESTLYERVRFGLAHLGQAGFQGDQAAIQWLGTAFLIDDDCTLVTAKHAVEGIPEDQLLLRFLGQEEGTVRTYPARVLHLADDRDLAFLAFGPEKGKRLCGTRGFQRIPIHPGGERVKLTGQAVMVLGFPALEGTPPRDVPVVRRGGVASAEMDWRGRPMLLLDLTGIPGFSGGPVILESTGEVIGVVYGPGRTERVYDLEWATPLTERDRGQAFKEEQR
jgi:S1-C subfamily serine protease